MAHTAIRAVDLGKQYRVDRPKEKYKTFRETLTRAALSPARALGGLIGAGRRDADPFWALSGVSFDVTRGEAVGVIGRNGAGKSTLLKVLSRITEPSAGYVDLHGRVASLLEVGTGFHPELTGRENVYLNGAILGMKRAEIARKFDEIIAFAEVDDFVDTPVKHYSSGMYLRLAFAVAAHLEPEILLVDEVLAVGDAAFQRKCLGKMEGVAREGRTILFVSHNMGAMSALCSRGIFLDRGRVVSAGPMQSLIAEYLASVQEVAASPIADRTDRGGDGGARVTEIAMTDARGTPLGELISGQECVLVIGYGASRPLSRPVFKGTIYNSVGQPLLPMNSGLVNAPFGGLPGRGFVACRLQRLPLSKGRYWMNVSIEDGPNLLDHVAGAYSFVVERGDFYGTGRNVDGLRDVCLVEQQWFAGDESFRGTESDVARIRRTGAGAPEEMR